VKDELDRILIKFYDYKISAYLDFTRDKFEHNGNTNVLKFFIIMIAGLSISIADKRVHLWKISREWAFR
jgi:hypothetical protein